LQNLSLEEHGLAESDAYLDKILEHEISDEVEQMLSCLNPSDRQLFLRIFAEEESVEQISRESGMKPETIYNHISRGKKKIRQNFLNERGVI
jgi:RNA polymerase sigma-70 factor (ECF subfamily)